MPGEPRPADPGERVRDLLKSYGRTYAQEAGIWLADQPSALYQLLVLATLLSARISAGVAVSAARELFPAGYRTPAAMAEAAWQDRVDAREVQEAWPSGLPAGRDDLAALLTESGHPSRLAAALVRLSLTRNRSFPLGNGEHHPAGGAERSCAAWSGGRPRRPVAVFRRRLAAAAMPSGNPPSLRAPRARPGGSSHPRDPLVPGCRTCPSTHPRTISAHPQCSTRTQYRTSNHYLMN